MDDVFPSQQLMRASMTYRVIDRVISDSIKIEKQWDCVRIIVAFFPTRTITLIPILGKSAGMLLTELGKLVAKGALSIGIEAWREIDPANIDFQIYRYPDFERSAWAKGLLDDLQATYLDAFSVKGNEIKKVHGTL